MMPSIAVKYPGILGEKAIETVQDALMARVTPQVVPVMENKSDSLPESVKAGVGALVRDEKQVGVVLGATIAVLQKLKAALPVLVTVTILAGELVLPGAQEPKLILVAESVAIGAVPVPDKDAVCVPPPLLALSITETVPLNSAAEVAE